jgi:hypothetical protein
LLAVLVEIGIVGIGDRVWLSVTVVVVAGVVVAGV